MVRAIFAKQCLAALGLLLVGTFAFGLAPESQRLIDFETKANAAAIRSNQPILIEHLEIPFQLIRQLSSSTSDAGAMQSLIFERDGKKYVRWIINPEDTKWHLELEKILRQNNVDTTHHRYFIGYQTASRSYLIEDPVTHAEFFAKVSTNHTGGQWKDKKQSFSDAVDVNSAADHVQNAIRKYQPKYFKYMDESLVFGFEPGDLGMVIRSLQSFNRDGFTYLPGFSALHEIEGRRIAELNGSNDPAAFWNEHYSQALGRALAEFAVMTGLEYDSPHSQNFLIELDPQMRPTGKIVLRDTGDCYLTRPYIDTFDSQLTKTWSKENVIAQFQGKIGLFYGNQKPTWMNDELELEWMKNFFKQYDSVFSRMTGLSEKVLIDNSGARGVPVIRSRNVGVDHGYFGKEIWLQGDEWKQYLEKLRQDGGFIRAARPLCAEVF